MEKRIRSFIAFELPDRFRELAGQVQDRLKHQGIRLRWVKPQNIHLTLRFLGDILPDQVAGVVDAMTQASQDTGPLELLPQGMGVFPGIKNPRVLWIGMGGQTDRLAEVAARLESCLEVTGFKPERRPFRAHLTLGRVKQAVDPRRLLNAIEQEGNFAAAPFRADEMVLFQSDLRPQGAVYTPLARVPLQESP